MAADIALAAALTVMVLVVIALFTTYNALVRSRNRVREAWSGIDVQLQRRASLIPNVVETVRGYAAHERGVFDEVARARSAVQQARGPAAAAAANETLTAALTRLLAVAEAYPQLRASENFAGLQRDLADVEDKIAFARQFYNRNVLAYNTSTETFPAVVVARRFGFEPADFFGAAEGGRSEVAVSFTGANRTVPPSAP
jgi:LemA protein